MLYLYYIIISYHNCSWKWQIYDYKEKKSRIIFGPELVMLGPDEQFTRLSLSGGKPKKPGQIQVSDWMIDCLTDWQLRSVRRRIFAYAYWMYWSKHIINASSLWCTGPLFNPWSGFLYWYCDCGDIGSRETATAAFLQLAFWGMTSIRIKKNKDGTDRPTDYTVL